MYLQASTTNGSLIPGSEYIRSLVRQGTISQDAARRLKWFDFYNRCEDARLTCRYFGISPKTFYRWKNRFDPYDLTTLEEESRRPIAQGAVRPKGIVFLSPALDKDLRFLPATIFPYFPPTDSACRDSSIRWAFPHLSYVIIKLCPSDFLDAHSWASIMLYIGA